MAQLLLMKRKNNKKVSKKLMGDCKKSILSYKTILFLDSQMKDLLNKLDNDNLTWDEKENLNKSMDVLLGKMKFEEREILKELENND